MKEQPNYQYRKAPYLGFVAENNCCSLHLHRHAEISYITDGERTVYIDDIPYHLTAGDLILIFPNQIHYLITPESCREICSIFDSNMVAEFAQPLTNYIIDNCVFHKDELDESTLCALNCLAHSGISKSYKQHAVPYMEKGYLTVILDDLLSKRELIEYDSKRQSYIVQRFFNYIENHISGDLRVETIAKELYLSCSALNENIKFYAGDSPHNIIKKRRLDIARTMLIITDKPVSVIARETGFSNERSFYRNFQEAYNKTPLEFRNKKRGAFKNTVEHI